VSGRPAEPSSRRIPLPVPSRLSRPLWEATREHVLKLQRCDRCHEWQWTPQVICRHCYSRELTWTKVSGRGTVYSYSVVQHAPSPGFETPYVFAIVELEEGPRMMTDIVGPGALEVSIGDAVEVVFEDFSEVTLFLFQRVPGG
jgi:uncharacterized OB-fold protein